MAEFFYILRSVWVVLASNAGQNLLFVNCGCKGKVLEQLSCKRQKTDLTSFRSAQQVIQQLPPFFIALIIQVPNLFHHMTSLLNAPHLNFCRTSRPTRRTYELQNLILILTFWELSQTPAAAPHHQSLTRSMKKSLLGNKIFYSLRQPQAVHLLEWLFTPTPIPHPQQ